ncbi:MAG TPA: phenylacetate-CoA oxygenase subunit PaaJ, partial [Bacteroidetes bacterium]|nr:phenylacetate-CoA oxygenase subunit PaaJ [Bacteroidota bacterium]
EAELQTALEAVKDPEIPVISVLDLGVIHSATINPEGKILVEMTPTFAGCPAIDAMKADIREKVTAYGVEEADLTIKVLYNEPWTTNKISPKGKILLKDFGLSPPPEFKGMLTLEVLQNAICPICSSNNTFMMTPFGPTACRAIHHCRNCKETFEQFKPL